jgi:opacity protein-like surface antigen
MGTAGMGGVGLSLRYRPVPHFAFDLGVDVLAGNDYNGFQRVEVPVTLNGMLYLNPRSRVQVYLMGGANISRAQVRSNQASPQLSLSQEGDQYGANYTYFGGQGGGGLEFRISRRVALNLDSLGFVRTRVDDHADRSPEFIDYRTGRTTNVSGGALVRGGLTFWW